MNWHIKVTGISRSQASGVPAGDRMQILAPCAGLCTVSYKAVSLPFITFLACIGSFPVTFGREFRKSTCRFLWSVHELLYYSVSIYGMLNSIIKHR